MNETKKLAMKIFYGVCDFLEPRNHVFFTYVQENPTIIAYASSKEELLINLELICPDAYLAPLSEHELSDYDKNLFNVWMVKINAIVKGIDSLESVKALMIKMK